MAILVDTSSGISAGQWNNVLDFMKQIVAGFDISPAGTHVALVPFSDKPKTSYAFNTPTIHTLQELNTYIGWLKRIPGFRYLDAALLHADSEVFQTINGMRENARKVNKNFVKRSLESCCATINLTVGQGERCSSEIRPKYPKKYLGPVLLTFKSTSKAKV